MKSSGSKRTVTTPIGHVQRDRPRKGHANEPATSLTRLAAWTLQLDAHLEPVFGRRDLDVSGPDSHACLDSGGDDLSFEEQLREAPIPTVLAHPDDDASGTSPDAFPGRLEPTGDQLAQLVRSRLLGSLGRGPLDGFVPVVGRTPDDAQVWFSRPRLFERQPEQLRAFLLREEGARDAGLVLGAAAASRPTGCGGKGPVRTVSERLGSAACRMPPFRHPPSQTKPSSPVCASGHGL